MNNPSFGQILQSFHTHVQADWQPAPDHDAYDFRISAYEADREGIPQRGGIESHATAGLNGRFLVSTRTRGGGHLIDLVRGLMQESATRVLEGHSLQRLVRRLDMALFALDHDGGHGVNVSSGVRELWVASGSSTWAGYAAKREEVLRWLDIFANQAAP